MARHKTETHECCVVWVWVCDDCEAPFFPPKRPWHGPCSAGLNQARSPPEENAWGFPLLRAVTAWQGKKALGFLFLTN